MIADETIDRVRREARIVAIVDERVKLTLRGRSHVGFCPFHKEKTPSFHVNEERRFYHCFGCAASGDAIKFVREVDGLSFVDAVREIAERQGIEIVETGSDDERREHAEARRRRDELYTAKKPPRSSSNETPRTRSRTPRTSFERRGLDPNARKGPSRKRCARSESATRRTAGTAFRDTCATPAARYGPRRR